MSEQKRPVEDAIDQFLTLPEVVAIGGLETADAPVATVWPVAGDAN